MQNKIQEITRKRKKNKAKSTKNRKSRLDVLRFEREWKKMYLRNLTFTEIQ